MMCHIPMYGGKKALVLLCFVFSFPEMATVKNELFCFPFSISLALSSHLCC